MRVFLALFAVLLCRAALADDNAPAVNPVNAPLLALKREQIALWQREITAAGRFAPATWLSTLRQIRARAAQIQGDPDDAADGASIQERAYFARNDGSAQVYYLALPDGYTPLKKWPLVVFLHGYSPSITKINPWILTGPLIEDAQKRGFILAMPYGRRDSDFVQWGQDDVMRVRAEVTRLFSVDEKRNYLVGTSMGGYGAYAMGFHTAGEWAAIAPIAARSDFYVWFNLEREQLPPWKRILFDADDPRTLALNARNTPLLVQHGELDGVVPVAHARLMAGDAGALGLPLQYIETPSGTHASVQVEAIERAFAWFETRPILPAPRALTLVAGDLREAKQSWARIEAFQSYTEMARLDVNALPDRIVVKTRNVGRFVLNVPPTFFPDGNPIPLEVDGVPRTVDPLAPVVWNANDAKTGKTPTKTGPFKSLMRDRFILVYGDAGDALAARYFAARWKTWADGDATIKSAAAVTEADKAGANLILFGTRETNALLAQIGAELPVELTPGGYRIGDKRVVAPYAGLRMVWKSPWNEARLIGVCSGVDWGETLPFNHIWDLIPDYIVYNAQTETDGTNRALEAGFFDGNWELPGKPMRRGLESDCPNPSGGQNSNPPRPLRGARQFRISRGFQVDLTQPVGDLGTGQGVALHGSGVAAQGRGGGEQSQGGAKAFEARGLAGLLAADFGLFQIGMGHARARGVGGSGCDFRHDFKELLS